MKIPTLKILVLGTAVCFSIAAHAVAKNHGLIEGRVISKSGSSLVGISILLQENGKNIRGAVTDANGIFKIDACELESKNCNLYISAIGHQDTVIDLFHIYDTRNPLLIVLNENPIDLGTVVVKPEHEIIEKALNINREQLARASRHSLITTNPLSAVKSTQVAREGSNHSSRFKIDGANPAYYINGIEMGQNPDHYGMFSILPGPAIDNLRLTTNGSDASFNSPAMIEFSTVQPFEQKPNTEIDLSFIEGTGSIFMGDKRFFFLSSIRKSILDRLADRLNSDSHGPTIPPTNFRDIFMSSGLRCSPNSRLLVDSYITGDYLAYNLGGTQTNPDGISISQNTGERFLGLRLETLLGKAFCKLSGAVKDNNENYHAGSLAQNGHEAFRVDLTSHENIYLANGSIDYQFERTILKTGASLKYYANKDILMRQTNWNFLPPDASSDIPYIYQRELNRFYGSYTGDSDQLSDAVYFSIAQKLGHYEIESGVRVEYFNYLAENLKTVYRFSASRKSKSFGDILLSCGTYAASPVSRILEPYQVLIDAYLAELSPVETRLLSLKYEIGPLTLGAHRQNMSRLPRIAPDFSRISEDGTPEPGFIDMASDGKINSYGYEIDLNPQNLISERLDLRASYAYGRAWKTTHGVTVPYELSSPHRFFAGLDYDLTRHISIGGDISTHSGYRYSTIPNITSMPDGSFYSDQNYRFALSAENSNQFDLNLISNLYADFDLGHWRIYAVISNITNRKNSIIKTADGFIYDAQMIPSIGLKYRL